LEKNIDEHCLRSCKEYQNRVEKEEKDMYIILVYDVEQKRVAKALKVCRGYLNWIQNSVFEGELTEGKFKELQKSLKKVTSVKKDSVLFFKMNSESAFEKEILGIEKAPTSNII